MDQSIIPILIFFFILITYLVDIVRRNSVLVIHGSLRFNFKIKGFFLSLRKVPGICLTNLLSVKMHTGFIWVLEDLESLGTFFLHFLGLESLGKRIELLESLGILFNSNNNVFRIYL